MTILVRCGHQFSAKDLLNSVQKLSGCESVECKGPDWFVVKTREGTFDIRSGEMRITSDSEGFIAQIEPTLQKLELDPKNTRIEIEGGIHLPYMVPLKLEMKKGFFDLLKKDDDIFWKRYRENVTHAVTYGIVKSRALKDAIKRHLTKSILKRSGTVLHCVYTWDMKVPGPDQVVDYVINDQDALPGGINFKGSINNVYLDVTCGIDCKSLEKLSTLKPKNFVDFGGVPFYLSVLYHIHTSGRNAKSLGDATRVMFNGMEDSFGSVCRELGFATISPSEKKTLEGLLYIPSDSFINDKECLTKSMDKIAEWYGST